MPLRKPAPAPVRNTMRTAFNSLSNVITPRESMSFRDSTLEDVKKEALDIENYLAARQSLRNMRRLMPLFTALEHYSHVMDTLCNGTPFLPWIWAPITLILRLACEYVEAFDALIKGYSRIGESMMRLKVLSDTFRDNADFHQTLAVFYSNVLEFHEHAYKFVSRRGWKLLFFTSWGRFQRRFENMLDDLKRHEDLIDREANARNIAEARDMRREILTWKEASLEQISLDLKEQAAKEFQAAQSWLRVDDSGQHAIFDSIANHGKKHAGTCTWILENTKIRSWLAAKAETRLLWLCGNAGSGKSVISTQLINFMKQLDHVTVLHHFCSNTSPTSLEYDQVLKTLIEQLLRLDKDLASYVYDEYVLKKQVATTSTLEALFRFLLASAFSSVSKASYLWVVIDGIEELQEDLPNAQARLVSLIKQLVYKGSVSESVICKVLISSRPSSTINKALRKCPTISLTEEKESLASAIQIYTSQRLESLQIRLQQLGFDAREIGDIGQQVTEKADGMFLYARLVLDFLSNNIFVHRDELRTAINTLPRTLFEFYHKLLAQILAPLDSNSVQHIRCILGWIAYSRRPLRKFELLSAVSFTSGKTELELPAPDYVLDICRSLVEERNDATLCFIHASVKMFLQDPSTHVMLDQNSMLNQHCLASVTCLLSSIRLSEQREIWCHRIIKGIYGFHVYSSEHWTDYVLEVASSNNGLDVHSTLYDNLSQLVQALSARFGQPEEPEMGSKLTIDERLFDLPHVPQLRGVVSSSLQARSLRSLEKELRTREEALSQEPHETKPMTRPETVFATEGISALLAQFQGLLSYILEQYEIPGISIQELEKFRSRYRTLAYTCRLQRCPRATLGFESKSLRTDHEMGHIRRYRCGVSTCQYPPFLSQQGLRRHMLQRHDSAPPRRSIRQPIARGGAIREEDNYLRQPIADGGAIRGDMDFRLATIPGTSKFDSPPPPSPLNFVPTNYDTSPEISEYSPLFQTSPSPPTPSPLNFVPTNFDTIPGTSEYDPPPYFPSMLHDG